ncbi:hypothetical protein [Rathayibacter festucae]|uniref:hypothetical protein n=1 Tax=Rathayibacter festucae TaxID=110937 RepID=UPI002A6AEF36|nr:hypothetical protein [Rathayibacter festucae]MDY0914279.1 hypothetical protein [Rathayibacter festucae]
MSGKRSDPVPRPIKGAEYEVVFGDKAAERGWNDLRATARNALADAWDHLTARPTQFDSNRCYRLRGDLSEVTVDGIVLPQWQYKVTNGGRLWYAVVEPDPKAKRVGRVISTNAAPGHPHETDSGKNFR